MRVRRSLGIQCATLVVQSLSMQVTISPGMAMNTVASSASSETPSAFRPVP